MTRPPPGLCVPVNLKRVIDGDTLEVVISGAYVWTVRLKDCWAPEKNTPEGREAHAHAEELLIQADKSPGLMLFVPFPDELLKPVNILQQWTTLGRVIGHIFVAHDRTISELMVRAGHATKQKPKTHKD